MTFEEFLRMHGIDEALIATLKNKQLDPQAVIHGVDMEEFTAILGFLDFDPVVLTIKNLAYLYLVRYPPFPDPMADDPWEYFDAMLHAVDLLGLNCLDIEFMMQEGWRFCYPAYILSHPMNYVTPQNFVLLRMFTGKEPFNNDVILYLQGIYKQNKELIAMLGQPDDILGLFLSKTLHSDITIFFDIGTKMRDIWKKQRLIP